MKTMTQTNKPASQDHVLNDNELNAVCGGADAKAEAQIMQTLSSTISNVMKNFGQALQTAARAG
jgi:hypothetical protein